MKMKMEITVCAEEASARGDVNALHGELGD